MQQAKKLARATRENEKIANELLGISKYSDTATAVMEGGKANVKAPSKAAKKAN